MDGIVSFNGVKVLAGDGARISVISKDGEVLYEATLQPGQHDLTQFEPALKRGDVEMQNMIIIERGASRVQTVSYGKGHNETGANPDWRPQFSEDVRIARMVGGMVKKQLRADDGKRLRHQQELDKRHAEIEAREAALRQERQKEKDRKEELLKASKEAGEHIEVNEEPKKEAPKKDEGEK